MCAITRRGVVTLKVRSWFRCLYVNWDLGVRRAVESGEEARKGTGEEAMAIAWSILYPKRWEKRIGAFGRVVIARAHGVCFVVDLES